MNSRATAELTLGRRSLCAQCATGVSCAATTWRSTPGATWPPRGSPAGRRRSAGSTGRPLRRTLGARWSRSARRPPPERATGGGGREFSKAFFLFRNHGSGGFLSKNNNNKKSSWGLGELVLMNVLLTWLFWLGPCSVSFVVSEVLLRKWKKIW